MSRRAKLTLLLIGIWTVLVAVALILPQRPRVSRPIEIGTRHDSADEREDASAIVACRDLNRLIRDTADGLLTTGEFRQQVKTIYQGSARFADQAKSPGIEPAARRLLAAATSGTTAETLAAIKAWQDACRAAPWARDQR